MISRIEGIAAEVENDGVIVMVGGLGLKVFTPQPLLNEIEAGKPVALRTHHRSQLLRQFPRSVKS